MMKMPFRIAEFPATKIAGKRMQLCMADYQVFKLWSSFMPVRNAIAHTIGNDLFSVGVYPENYFLSYSPERFFDRWAGREVSATSVLPDGLEFLDIPSGLYAVFQYTGDESRASEAYEWIFTQWLPGSDYNLDHRPHFEILGKHYRRSDPDSQEEIWIPVRKK